MVFVAVVVPVAQAALTTSRVMVNHEMVEPALLLVAIPLVRGLS